MIITTYDTVAMDSTSGKALLNQISWFRIILDEAHVIRNSSTLTFKAIEALSAERRWCLTGTPVHNSLGDIFSLARFLRYYPFADPSVARKLITHPLQKRDRKGLDNLESMMKLFSLRRVRDLSNLPKLQERVISVELFDSERHDYNSMKKGALSELTVLSRSKISKKQHITLRLELRLRQICCHGLLREQGPGRSPSLAGDFCSNFCSASDVLENDTRDSNRSPSGPLCSYCLSHLPKFTAMEPSLSSEYGGPYVEVSGTVHSPQYRNALASGQHKLQTKELSSKLAAVISNLTRLGEIALSHPDRGEKR